MIAINIKQGKEIGSNEKQWIFYNFQNIQVLEGLDERVIHKEKPQEDEEVMKSTQGKYIPGRRRVSAKALS